MAGFSVAGYADDVVAELFGVGLGHGIHPSSSACRHHRSDVTYPCSSPALSNLTTAEIPPAPVASIPTEPTTDPRFEYRTNLLIRAGRTRYHYDTAGRLIRKEKTRISRKPAIWHYRYNAFDQLTEVTTPDGNTWTYTYDAFGRRTSKQNHADNIRTEFAWDGVHLTEQATTTRTGTHTHTWTNHPTTYVPLAQSVDDQFWAIVTNLQGAPTHLTNPETGEIASTATADLWGRTTWTGPETPHRFQGQQHDPESGLHYNYHRYYDPETARYLTQDPLGLSPSPNSTTYPHNPLVWSDPLGLTPCGLSREAPRLEDGNSRTGWRHIEQRHIPGGSNNQGSLFAAGTTRDQIETAAREIVERGTRQSDPSKECQVFERRMTINGLRTNYRLVVDSTDGNNIVTMFPILGK
ncbi:RHS repeat-associated core domain-containing protein [Nocardia salmonicida]|uniref:RHS repeat-associated core domain-containing protein n=1 Tax=Nocardia salmonicida TaxID=53431 RepID=UPI002E2A4A8D|nr:RHS repeat-associated core domain-containing protein [Nocardia salmonicida]